MKKAISLILSTILVLAYLVRPAWALQGFSGGIPTSGPGSGTVTSVTGTTNQIGVTSGTTTPGLSITGLAGVTGPISATGNSGNCTDVISSVDGIWETSINPVACGLVISTSSTTATGSAGSYTLAAAGDFKNGQAISIAHGAGATSASAPTSPSVQSSKWSSSLTVAADGSGSTDYSYQAFCNDGLGGGPGPLSATTITNGAATLTFSAFNQYTFTAGTGCVSYSIYGCSGASCSPLLQAVIPQIQGVSTDTYWDFGTNNHFGTDTPDGTGVPSGALADNLFTTIATGGGTTSITTANATGGSVTAMPFFHDNEPALASATSQICTSGGTMLLPKGVIPTAQTWNISGCSGVRVIGSGSSSNLGTPGAGTEIYPTTMGQIAVELNGTSDVLVQDFDVTTEGGHSTMTAGLCMGCQSGAMNNNRVYRVNVGQSAEAFALEATGTNVSESSIAQSYATNNGIGAGGYISFMLNNSQAKETLLGDHDATNNLRSFDVYANAAGWSTRLFTYNSTIGNYLNHANNPIFIQQAQSDSATNVQRFFTFAGNIGGYQQVTIQSSILNPASVASDGVYMGFIGQGTVLLLNNDFGHGTTVVSPWTVYFNANQYNGQTPFTSIGNLYPNSAPFNSPNGVFGGSALDAYNSIGDTFLNGSSTVRFFPVVLSGTASAMSKLGTKSSNFTMEPFQMTSWTMGASLSAVVLPTYPAVPTGAGIEITAYVTQGGSAFTLAFSGLNAASATPPALTSTTGQLQAYKFFSTDGSSWFYLGS